MTTTASAAKRPNPTLKVWVTKSGERIAVKDMSDSHLVNTIRMLRRWGTVAKLAAWFQIRVYLDGDPPDGAFDCASMEERRLDEMPVDEFIARSVITFAAMLKEAQKRRIGVQP